MPLNPKQAAENRSVSSPSRTKEQVAKPAKIETIAGKSLSHISGHIGLDEVSPSEEINVLRGHPKSVKRRSKRSASDPSNSYDSMQFSEKVKVAVRSDPSLRHCENELADLFVQIAGDFRKGDASVIDEWKSLAAEVRSRVRKEISMSPADRASFEAHSSRHKWTPNDGSAIDFIRNNFSTWFDRGLSRKVIEEYQPELVIAYAEEVKKNTRKRIREIQQVHSLPPGTKRVVHRKIAADMSHTELEKRREADRRRQSRYRERRMVPCSTNANPRP